jgi:hypothetical protein
MGRVGTEGEQAMRAPSFHFHSCPECHRVEPCAQGCSIEPDLGLHGDVPAGTHTECSVCLERTDEAFGALRAVSDAIDVMTLMQMYADEQVAIDRQRSARICDDALALWRAGSTHITFQSIAERIVRGDEPMPLCWDPRRWESAQFNRGRHGK